MSFDEFDEDLEIAEEPTQNIKSKTPAVASKTPSAAGKKVSVYFVSTVGPGEKKQKLTVNDGNSVDEVKRTVGNLFGLNPNDFHLSSGGVTMDDSSPLRDYHISDGDDVLLIPASTAGKF